MGAVDGTPESKGGPNLIPPHPRKDEETEVEPAIDRRNPRDQRRSTRRSTRDDHPPSSWRRKDHDDSDGGNGGHTSQRSLRPPSNSANRRLHSGRDRDRSPRGRHHGSNTEGRRRDGEVGAPPISQERANAPVDLKLQDLFASYAKSIREALQDFQDNNQFLSPSQVELRGDWLCKAEAYVKAASAAAAHLGLTPSCSAQPSASWSSFLQAAGHLVAPSSPSNAGLDFTPVPRALLATADPQGSTAVLQGSQICLAPLLKPAPLAVVSGGRAGVPSASTREPQGGSPSKEPSQEPDADLQVLPFTPPLQLTDLGLPSAPLQSQSQAPSPFPCLATPSSFVACTGPNPAPSVTLAPGESLGTPQNNSSTPGQPQSGENLHADQESVGLRPLHLPAPAEQDEEQETGQWPALKAALFTSPPPSLLATPAPPQTRCAPGRLNLRRSIRLAAKKKSGSMLVRAQEALAHKLGTLPKDRPLTETALKDYLATFEAPLPEDTISALAQLFKVDCQLTQRADDALLELGGHPLMDSQEVAASPSQASTASLGGQAVAA